ncbi:hypothetical protein M8J77_002858 [Diaphorina citri]|nr:hypothetical protein M8J77_002858 [Diaphorina citri]
MMTRRQAQGRSTHGVNKRPSLPKAPVEQSKPNKKKNATVKGPSAKTKTSGSLAKTQTSGSSSGSKRPSYSSTLSSSPLPTPTGSRMVPTSSKTATGSKIPLPTPTSSKMAKEIDALKQLNADLIQRLKSIEEELKSTKQLCDELLANSSAPAPVLSVPELNLEHEHTPPEPSPALPPPDTHDHDTRNPYLLVCGDSMTRDFGEILQRLLPHYSVLSHTLPGASLSSVLNDLPSLAKNFNKKDIVFVLAGTNDVPLLSPDRLEHEFQRLSTLAQSTNLIFSRESLLDFTNSEPAAADINTQANTSVDMKMLEDVQAMFCRRLFTRVNHFYPHLISYLTLLEQLCLPTIESRYRRIMSGDSSHVPESALGNDTSSNGEIVHLDAPYDGWIMVCGFLIAMVLVAFIIILVAFTIRISLIDWEFKSKLQLLFEDLTY